MNEVVRTGEGEGQEEASKSPYQKAHFSGGQNTKSQGDDHQRVSQHFGEDRSSRNVCALEVLCHSLLQGSEKPIFFESKRRIPARLGTSDVKGLQDLSCRVENMVAFKGFCDVCSLKLIKITTVRAINLILGKEIKSVKYIEEEN